MIRVFIVRHGETEWNRERRFQGWEDSPLTTAGREQVLSLAERLKEYKLEYLYSSPSGRTMETARIIANMKDLDIIKEPGFKEINLGDLEGKRVEWVNENYPDILNDFWNDPVNYEPLSGESFYDLKNRVLDTLDNILNKHGGENVMIVSHAAASKMMLSFFEGRKLEDLWEPPELKAASLSIVDIEEGEANIKFYGDTSHYRTG
ncbi:MAG: histidine phosphatase family protein [Candidatus Saliniplasma sp.]